MNKDEFEKYYESAEANEDSKSDAKVILFLVTVVVIAMTYWVANTVVFTVPHSHSRIKSYCFPI